RSTDRITSGGMIGDLVADETAPWATYNKGKPISQRQVAGLLKPYWIKPKTIRLDDGSTPKGYMLEWFTDVFSRFCSSSSPPTPPPPLLSPPPPPQIFFQNTFRIFHPPQAQSMWRIKMTTNPLISTDVAVRRMKTGVRPEKRLERPPSQHSAACSGNGKPP